MNKLVYSKCEACEYLASATTPIPMDPFSLVLGLLTVTMLIVTFNAWRIGNEKRDVALLGTVGALLGVGTVFTVIT